MPLHSELIFQSKTTYYDKTGKSYEGPSVDSKYLTDSNGNYVINPTSPTGEPYIIPANMDFDSLIKVFEGFHTPEQTLLLLSNFRTSGSFDLQRTNPDGTKYQFIDDNKIKHELFVSDYTSSASLYFGAASVAMCVPSNIAEAGGGGLNLLNNLLQIFSKGSSSINIDGKYFNNPNNILNIEQGITYYKNNISNDSILDIIQDSIDTAFQNSYDMSHYVTTNVWNWLKNNTDYTGYPETNDFNLYSLSTTDVANATSILTTLYPLVDTPLSDSYFNVNITSTGEQLSIKKTISPDTQKATYTLTASDLMNASAIIDSVFGMIDSSAITPSDVIVNLTDTNISTTLTKGNLLYELGTKGFVDLYSMLGNNPWLIDESNIILSNQHYEISGLESSIASLESALNSTDASIVEDASGKFSTIKANGNTFVITDHGQIIQYDASNSKVFVVTGQYTESSYTLASTTPMSDELLGSIAEALSTSSTVTLPEGFDGSIVLSSNGNQISLAPMSDSDGNVIGTIKTIKEGDVETTTQSFDDASLPLIVRVKTDGFVANYSDGVFQGFSSMGNVALSDGFNQLLLENLHVKGVNAPSIEDIQHLNLTDTTEMNDFKDAFDATMKNSVSVTDYYGAPKLVTQSEATLQTIGTGIASLTDALSLINAIQSGKALPIAVTGIRLAADIDYLDGVRDMPNLAAASSIASGILSIMSLTNALKKGDTIGAVTAGANALYFSATGYAVLSSSSTEVAKALSTTFGDTATTTIGSLGNALPYLNIVNSIAHGDALGAGVGVASLIWRNIPYVGWAYAVYSIVKSLFGHHDSIPDPWGNGQYIWNGNSITYQSAGQTGGKEAVSNVMNNVLSVLNNLIEQERKTNPTSALGIIPNRMPTIAYDMSGYRYTDIDPLTGEEKHAYLRFDTSGNPYNATPGSTESYQSIIEAMVRSALSRSAIAPLWEVQTAKMQTDAGDPKAGLTEEARAGRDGALATTVTGDTQTFRPVTLDLSGDGKIDVISKDASAVSFDVDDSGYLKKTAWIDGGDAFLTLDRDYNGETNTGKEMFSNAAVALGRRGLAGMAWVDANYDGKITAADPVWNELRIWQDVNEDGIEVDAESHKLSDLGITELNYAMGTFTQNGVVKKLSSQDLVADTEGSRINVVPEGIIVESSKGELSLLVTRIDDQTAVQANQDGISGYEDVEMIIAAADLLANDKVGGFSGRDLSLSALGDFKHGTGFIDANGFVHFIPEANYAGSDAGFSYTTTAQNGQSGTGEVKIILQNVNDAPTLDHVEHETRAVYGYTPIRLMYNYHNDTRFYLSGGTPIYDGNLPIAYEDSGKGKVIGADIDDPTGSLTYELVNGPQYGSISIDAQGNYTYVSWKEPGIPSDRIVVDGQYGALKDGNLYTQDNLPSQAVYPTTDVFQVKITDPHGATTIQSITVPHFGPYLPPTPPGGGGGKKPIAVDLNGDGFNFVNVNDSNVFFDVTGDGWKRKTAWVGADDGILAFDSDNNGKIEKASEISFVGYKESAQTDLEGLKAFDTNNDGKFDASDEKWNQFGIWQDANQNGITDEGEFKKLSDLGIESIGLSSDGKFTVINKQTVHGVGSMTKSDGTSLAIADVTLEYSAETQIPGINTSVTPTSPFSTSGEEINGTEDKDLILGKNGNNIINAYSGDDVIFEDGGNDIIYAGDGNDVAYSGADNDLVFAGKGNDVVYGGKGDDVILGEEGNDVLFAEEGNDIVFGGEGNDFISGGAGNDVLSGDAGNDELYGESGNDALFGSDGDDKLSGLDGHDRLDGGAGNDMLDGGSDADEMIGGVGDDTYVVDDAADIVTELVNEGNDTVNTSIDYTLGANLENLTLLGDKNLHGIGNELDNIIIGNSKDNILEGQAGNDTLNGGLGADRMIGGLGDDSYYVDNSGDVVVEAGGEGNDTIYASVNYKIADNVEKLVLTGYEAINATGNDANNILVGNSASNILDGSLGADVMSGGKGDDTYIVDNANDTVTELSNEGIDTIKASISWTLGENTENLFLTGNESINATGNTLNNILVGNGATNILDGGLGADAMAGKIGDDIYYVDNANDTAVENANEGYDTIRSSLSYTVSANVERLELLGSEAINATGNDLDNILIGNSANNILDGGLGVDVMSGGKGDDTYIVDNANDTVTELSNEGIDTIKASVSWTLGDNTENLFLTGNEVINAIGNELDNILVGNSANNILDGGLGADAMSGGAGNDIYYVDNTNDTIVENANGGNDSVVSQVTYTLSENVENVTLAGSLNINATGNALDNVLIGNSANNILDGGLGADAMSGQAGDDIYIVENANDMVVENINEGYDTIHSSVSYTASANVERLELLGSEAINATGNDLDNVLIGNSANNILDGGLGVDAMSGQAGDDIYYVDNTNDTVVENSNEGYDTIRSSVSYTASANVERLELLGSEAINATGNDLDNVLIGNNAANILDGRLGTDAMSGGTGDDIYIVDNTNDTVIENVNEGYDTIRSSVSYTASANVERLELLGSEAINATGNELDNILVGNSANNILDGGLGVDVMSGGKGDDTYIVDNANDTVVENINEGIDSVISSVSYTLSNNVENLTLVGDHAQSATGNDLDNTIQGNALDNIIDGKKGADAMLGAQGNDSYYVDNEQDRVIENFNEGIDTIYSSVSYVLPENVENLIMIGDGSISASGNSANNTLIGNGADNYIFGGAGDDYIDGKGGNNTLEGGLGNDMLIGSSGNDTFVYNLGDGLDTIIEAQGDDTVKFTQGLSLDNVALRVANVNGKLMAQVRILNEGGCEQADQGFDFEVSQDKCGRFVSPIEHFTFADGSSKTLDDLLIKTQVTYASFWQTTIQTGRNDDIIYASPFSNVIHSGTGNDIVYAYSGGDTVYGEGGNDYLYGDIGNDTLDGGCGNDILSGACGNDYLKDSSGNNILLGGSGRDTIIAGKGNDFIAGGTWDDTLNGGAGYNVFAFNHGDGYDTILPAVGAHNTLSLSGVDLDDIKLSKKGDDLIFNMGCNSQVTLKNWYTSEENQNFDTLQMVSSTYEYNFGFLHVGITEKPDVETFDFHALVEAFDEARTANPRLNSWNAMNGLLDAHLSSSDSAAIGGDLAWNYAKSGDLSNVALASAQTILQNPSLGASTQAINTQDLCHY